MAIVCACVGSVLYVRASSGFSLNDYNSRAIFARVRVWKLHVLLIIHSWYDLYLKLSFICFMMACSIGS
jgi:hypothetical protein